MLFRSPLVNPSPQFQPQLSRKLGPNLPAPKKFGLLSRVKAQHHRHHRVKVQLPVKEAIGKLPLVQALPVSNPS